MHRVHDDRLAGSPRESDEGIGDFVLRPGEVASVVAVAAEVARDDHCIDLGRRQHRFEDPGEGPGILLAGAGEVDGVRGRTGRSRQQAQFRRQLRREARHDEPGRLGDVGGDSAVAAPVGEHPHPRHT